MIGWSSMIQKLEATLIDYRKPGKYKRGNECFKLCEGFCLVSVVRKATADNEMDRRNRM